MSQIRAANLIRVYGSGTVPTTDTLVGLSSDPVVIAQPATSFGLNVGVGAFGVTVPIQWEFKNDSQSGVTLEISFELAGFTPSYVLSNGVIVLDNWMRLLPGQSFSMQKRHYAQEFTPLSTDLVHAYLRGVGAACPFTVTVDLWTPSTGP
jgi:hypothetical protein